MKRNAALELYRVVMMFGVCWLHCCQQGGRLREIMPVYYLLRPCVVGFIFISGYFGIKFAWPKVFRLLGICLCSTIVSVLLRYLTAEGLSWTLFIKDVGFSILTGYWFLWAYLALMLISPILNAAVEGDEKAVNQRIVPFLILVFGWSYLLNVPVVKRFVPSSSGLSQLSFVTMAGVYMMARIFYLRRWDVVFGRRIWLVFILSAGFCALGFAHYNSIFAIGLSASLFCIIKRLPMLPCMERYALLIAPSMFAVYILHQTYRGFGFVEMGVRCAKRFSGNPMALTFIAAVIVFSVCVILDFIRRGCLYVLGRVFK